ncbi:hypothetical protein LOK49_LG09G00702 [Camellia lanceoleosa]|uniref:Uncharacterized protein n=1 Tax=Camellia lanceoleosa TaxID=1840588 RepID=A0ACC0GGV0_9ERIC|nr:hypothetical protein LOK49_LG09G00702 [Camellia lanceoleosa]
MLLHQENTLNSAVTEPTNFSLSGWVPARHGSVKFSCDAAYCKSSSTAAALMILRDSKGNLLDGNSQVIEAFFAAQVEAHVVRLACIMAHAHNLSHVEIESDNQTVIQLSHHGNIVR